MQSLVRVRSGQKFGYGILISVNGHWLCICVSWLSPKYDEQRDQLRHILDLLHSRRRMKVTYKDHIEEDELIELETEVELVKTVPAPAASMPATSVQHHQ